MSTEQSPVKEADPSDAESVKTQADPAAAKADSVPDDNGIELALDTKDKGYVDKTVILPNEKFDYVIPKETFKQHVQKLIQYMLQGIMIIYIYQKEKEKK